MSQTITIASGKGGVGKTSFAVNLALMLQGLGNRTTLMDVDFGLANAHIMLGINAKRTLSDVLSNCASIENVVETGPNGLQLLAGGSGTIDLLHISQADRFELIRRTDALSSKTDILVIDAPAGAGDNTLDFIAASDRVVVVIVPEPTSFMDAYALIKSANLERKLHRFSIVMNMESVAMEAQKHFEKFRAIAMRFLDVELTYLGHVPNSQRMRRAVQDRRPVLVSTTNRQSAEFMAFHDIAQRLQTAPKNDIAGIRFFGGADGMSEKA
jgi:flagellar biosynthesis protein FlhG